MLGDCLCLGSDPLAPGALGDSEEPLDNYFHWGLLEDWVLSPSILALPLIMKSGIILYISYALIWSIDVCIMNI